MLATLRKFLAPPPGLDIDFTLPQGAPALAPADGVSWRVFANPISLFIGGVTAVLLELAQPSVRTGVWDFSSFRRDPFTRLHRTGYAAMVTVYAPRNQAQAMIERVVRMHTQVRGQTPDGAAYEANDPHLLNWVQATAVFGFTQAYDRYVQQLSAAEKNAAFQEAQASAILYGALGLPHSWSEWEGLLHTMSTELEPHSILEEFLHTMVHANIFPRPMHWLQKLLVKAAVDLTPEPVRSMAQLQPFAIKPAERAGVRTLAIAARWLPIPQLPPSQARKRMR